MRAVCRSEPASQRVCDLLSLKLADRESFVRRWTKQPDTGKPAALYTCNRTAGEMSTEQKRHLVPDL
jgi:hypothetical protein